MGVGHERGYSHRAPLSTRHGQRSQCNLRAALASCDPKKAGADLACRRWSPAGATGLMALSACTVVPRRVLALTVQLNADLRIGTAGWSIPGHQSAWFPTKGSHLERYAQRLRATEINSSFYRSHKPQTYARWAASVPADFRFAVKLPREITHTRKLVAIVEPLDRFLEEIRSLSGKLGPLLVQLPPSLAFSEEVSDSFFSALRERFAGNVVCEPRHPTWFGPTAGKALAEAHVARVAADPAVTPEAKAPGGWKGLTYHRLHGSPVTYSSAYNGSDLDRLASDLRGSLSGGGPCWCIFDNTTRGEAAGNAHELCQKMFAEDVG